jgi:hypothetical protein
MAFAASKSFNRMPIIVLTALLQTPKISDNMLFFNEIQNSTCELKFSYGIKGLDRLAT